jgi:hypothetical protein
LPKRCPRPCSIWNHTTDLADRSNRNDAFAGRVRWSNRIPVSSTFSSVSSVRQVMCRCRETAPGFFLALLLLGVCLRCAPRACSCSPQRNVVRVCPSEACTQIPGALIDAHRADLVHCMCIVTGLVLWRALVSRRFRTRIGLYAHFFTTPGHTRLQGATCGRGAILRAPPSTMLRRWSCHIANALRTSRSYVLCCDACRRPCGRSGDSTPAR